MVIGISRIFMVTPGVHPHLTYPHIHDDSLNVHIEASALMSKYQIYMSGIHANIWHGPNQVLKSTV
jgi:hypothetical protein